MDDVMMMSFSQSVSDSLLPQTLLRTIKTNKRRKRNNLLTNNELKREVDVDWL